MKHLFYFLMLFIGTISLALWHFILFLWNLRDDPKSDLAINFYTMREQLKKSIL